MSWLSKLFGGGSSATVANRMIVDGTRWGDGRGGDRQSPREQVQILQAIARFAKQEKLETQVVFEGRPLREVSDDGDFNGIKAFFTEKQGSAGDLVLSRARSAGARGLVVFTTDPAVEQKASSQGYIVMHTSTLRKATEGGGQQFEGGAPMMRGGDRGDRGDRGGRRRPMGGGRPQPQQRQPQRQPQQAEGVAPEVDRSNQSVRNLIDLVETPVRQAAPAPAPVQAEPAPAPQSAPPPPPPAAETSAPPSPAAQG